MFSWRSLQHIFLVVTRYINPMYTRLARYTYRASNTICVLGQYDMRYIGSTLWGKSPYRKPPYRIGDVSDTIRISCIYECNHYDVLQSVKFWSSLVASYNPLVPNVACFSIVYFLGKQCHTSTLWIVFVRLANNAQHSIVYRNLSRDSKFRARERNLPQ